MVLDLATVVEVMEVMVVEEETQTPDQSHPVPVTHTIRNRSRRNPGTDPKADFLRIKGVTDLRVEDRIPGPTTLLLIVIANFRSLLNEYSPMPRGKSILTLRNALFEEKLNTSLMFALAEMLSNPPIRRVHLESKRIV